MSRSLIFAAVAEVATGVALFVAPSLVGELLLGASTTGIALIVARVTGIALIALGVACWPGTPLVGMFLYTALVMAYLAFVGLQGEWVGPLLWPAVAVHLILAALLGRRLLTAY